MLIYLERLFNFMTLFSYAFSILILGFNPHLPKLFLMQYQSLCNYSKDLY